MTIPEKGQARAEWLAERFEGCHSFRVIGNGFNSDLLTHGDYCDHEECEAEGYDEEYFLLVASERDDIAVGFTVEDLGNAEMDKAGPGVWYAKDTKGDMVEIVFIKGGIWHEAED